MNLLIYFKFDKIGSILLELACFIGGRMESRISVKKESEYPWYMRILYRMQRKKYGMTLLPTKIWGRCPTIFLGFLAMFRRLNRKKSPIDKNLRALVSVRISQINHCPFCVDMNSSFIFKKPEQMAKLDALPTFRESSLFSDLEKAALNYAEKITFSDTEVDDATFQEVRNHFSDDDIVELTALIAFQNMSSKFNAALDIPLQGLCRKAVKK